MMAAKLLKPRGLGKCLIDIHLCYRQVLPPPLSRVPDSYWFRSRRNDVISGQIAQQGRSRENYP